MSDLQFQIIAKGIEALQGTVILFGIMNLLTTWVLGYLLLKKE